MHSLNLQPFTIFVKVIQLYEKQSRKIMWGARLQGLTDETYNQCFAQKGRVFVWGKFQSVV